MIWLTLGLAALALLGLMLAVAPSMSERRERVLFGIFSAIVIGTWAVLIHVLLD